MRWHEFLKHCITFVLTNATPLYDLYIIALNFIQISLMNIKLTHTCLISI
jgi:hypothetical protein